MKTVLTLKQRRLIADELNFRSNHERENATEEELTARYVPTDCDGVRRLHRIDITLAAQGPEATKASELIGQIAAAKMLSKCLAVASETIPAFAMDGFPMAPWAAQVFAPIQQAVIGNETGELEFRLNIEATLVEMAAIRAFVETYLGRK